MTRFHLLTAPESQPKLTKTMKFGVYSAALHLQAGRKDTCPWATKGCKRACLTYSGRGRMAQIQEARKRRTEMFFKHRDSFDSLLRLDLDKLARTAKKHGMIPACRLNATSDLGWESLIREFPDIRFYDYTKSYERYLHWVLEPDFSPINYHLTFSYSETTTDDTVEYLLCRGGTIAVPFNIGRHDPMITRWQDFPVIDGDTHDARFIDPRSVIVGLRVKVNKGTANNPFIQDVP